MAFKEVDDVDEKIKKMKKLIEKTTNLLMKHRMSLKQLEQKRLETENKAMIDFLRKKGISGEQLLESFSENEGEKENVESQEIEKAIENLGGDANEEH